MCPGVLRLCRRTVGVDGCCCGVTFCSCLFFQNTRKELEVRANEACCLSMTFFKTTGPRWRFKGRACSALVRLIQLLPLPGWGGRFFGWFIVFHSTKRMLLFSPLSHIEPNRIKKRFDSFTFTLDFKCREGASEESIE